MFPQWERSRAHYLLKQWLITLIFVLALKSSGSSMTGTGTWLRSLICAWSMGETLMSLTINRSQFNAKCVCFNTEWLTPHIRTLSTGSLARKTFTFCCTKCFFLVFLLGFRGPGGMEEEAALGEDIALSQVIPSSVCVSRLAVAPVESCVYVK